MDPLLRRVDLRGRPADDAADDAAIDAAGQSADDGLEATVAAIIARVRRDGDAALRELTERFDGVSIDDIEVPRSELVSARDALTPGLRSAMELVVDQVDGYHRTQTPRSVSHDSRGVHVVEVTRPVARAGCYVPGGLAVYPSTVIMTVVPARVAGVDEVVVCVPPASNGRVPTPTLAAAALAGAGRVMRVGGAQAVAALAFGTETVPAVDVIVGPGNRYVAEAKRQVVGTVGIDALAGPSEVVVVASNDADPAVVAADLLAQAEHGPGGGAVVVTWEPSLADAVDAEVSAQLATADRREEAASTLASGGRLLLVDDPGAAIAVANRIAPEHLELVGADAEALVSEVRNAGAVFVGPYSSAVVGDYVAGTNHVLPTGRTARFASALGVDTFRKQYHVVEVDRDALAALEPAITSLAEAEGLTAHRDAVMRRLGRLGK